MIRPLILLIAATLASPALAQSTVVLTGPNTVNSVGQPRTVSDVFVRNADGSIATVGQAAGGALETTQEANRQALLAILAAQQQTTTAVTTGYLTREDARVIAGGGFTVSTGIQAISAGNSLSAALTNTSGTQSLVMTSRILACNAQTGAVVSEYTRYAPTAVLPASPTPTAVTVGNRISGGAAIPAAFAYSMGPSVPTGGAATSSGFVPLNANRLEIKEIVIVPPASKLVYSIGGSGGGLAQTARCAMTFLGYLVG